MRHGAPENGREKRFYGMTDIPLSETGEEQIRRTAVWLRDRFRAEEVSSRAVKVVSSPLQRCARSARIASEILDTGGIEIRPDLREINLGEWEARAVEEIRSRYPAEYERRGRALGSYRIPGGETFDEVSERMGVEVKKLCAEKEENILVFTHAGAIRALLCPMSGVSCDRAFDFAVPFASVTELIRAPGTAHGLRTERVGYRPISLLDVREIKRMYMECGTSPQVVDHMKAVARTCAGIMDRLDPAKVQNGTAFSKGARERIEKAALLHDILRAEHDHAARGADYLERQGYQDIAPLVRAHHSTEIAPDAPLSEGELLSYADEITMGTECVTLGARFEASRPRCSGEQAVKQHRLRYVRALSIEDKIRNFY